ncbi:MAG: hypothetical protein AAFN93_04745 [Bacteroidota bacterium]
MEKVEKREKVIKEGEADMVAGQEAMNLLLSYILKGFQLFISENIAFVFKTRIGIHHLKTRSGVPLTLLSYHH